MFFRIVIEEENARCLLLDKKPVTQPPSQLDLCILLKKVQKIDLNIGFWRTFSISHYLHIMTAHFTHWYYVFFLFKDTPISAGYGECSFVAWIDTNFMSGWDILEWNPLCLSLCVSANNVASGKENVNTTGLVVGVVFGSAAAVMMVLGGWFALKKFYLI